MTLNVGNIVIQYSRNPSKLPNNIILAISPQLSAISFFLLLTADC
jgi:hypothetical protein